MATVRTIQPPSSLPAVQGRVLSPDGTTIACRAEGSQPGLYAHELANGQIRPLLLDGDGRRYHSPFWSGQGDLLFSVESPQGPAVGVVPAFGRGSRREIPGTGIAVSPDGQVLAVADPKSGAVLAAAADRGNSPLQQPLKKVAPLKVADPSAAIEMEVTRDGRYVMLVCRRPGQGPSLWAYPLEGGDAQEIASQVASPATLSFALSKSLLAVLEIRHGPVLSSRVYVRPLSAGSLGALRLGPARDLLFARQELPVQRPAFSPDAKKLAVLGAAVPALPGGPPNPEMALELLPTGGGKPERALQARELRGSPRFLESGEVVIDGSDRVAVVTL